MNKSKLTMAVIGGVAGLLAVAIGVLVWLEADAHDVKDAELASARSRAAGNASANPAVTKARKENEKALVDWAKASYAFVAERSARAIDPSQEPSAFKQQMMDEQRALAKLPEDSETKIIKETFYFGDAFRDFISQGSMPKKEDMPRLQRQWDDLMHLAEVFLKAGVSELTDVSFKAVAAAEPVVAERGRGRGGRGAETVDAKAAYPSSEETYVVKFLARPEALVSVLNALATDEKRFMSVVLRRFEQAGDPLVAMLGGGDKEKDGGGSRRRRSRAVEFTEAATDGEGAEAEVARKGLVTDPKTCAPFTVTLEVTTYDFVPAGEEEKK